MLKKYILLNILNILDIITTYSGLKVGLFETNYFYEVLILINPIIHILIKILVVLFFSFILYKAKSKVGFNICIIAFILIVISNIIMIGSMIL